MKTEARVSGREALLNSRLRAAEHIIEVAPAAFAAERRWGVPADWLIASHLVTSKFGTIPTALPFGRTLDPKKTLEENNAAMWDPSENIRLLAEHVASPGAYPRAMEAKYDATDFVRALYRHKFDASFLGDVIKVICVFSKFVSNLREDFRREARSASKRREHRLRRPSSRK